MFFNEKKTRLSSRQFDQEVERLVEWVQKSVSPFENDSAKKQAARVRRAMRDQDYFNRTYLPHYFTEPSAPFHKEMEGLTDQGERESRPVAIGAPRGHAKSTHNTLARPLKRILNREKRFIIIVGEDETLARGNTVSIRVELEHNPRILHDFGNQRTAAWAAGDFVTMSGTKVLARGIGQGVRGRKHGPHRPDYIIIDDPEDDELVRNPDRIKKLGDWVNEAVLPALDPKAGVVVWLGTLLSKRSALARAMANTEWISKLYRAIQDPVWDDEKHEFTGGVPLWPARFPLATLSRERRRIGSLAFNKEYQNEPRDDEAMFQEEWIRKYQVKWNELPNLPAYTYQGIDPSAKKGQSGDFKADVTASRLDNRIYIRNAWIQKTSISRMILNALTLQQRFDALQVGLEVIVDPRSDGYETPELMRLFYAAAQQRRQIFPLIAIHQHGESKDSEYRIGGMSALIENGILCFCYGPTSEVGDMETLIEQFCYFPSPSVHDDGPDAADIARRLAERRTGSRPFYERVAKAQAGDGRGF